MLRECLNGHARSTDMLELTLLFFQALDYLVDEVLACDVDTGYVEVRERQWRDLVFDYLLK